MPLSENQLRALEVLDWLFRSDDSLRQTGRSLVWVVALIREAARHPGQWVEISDHAEQYTHLHRHLHEGTQSILRELVSRDFRLDGNLEIDQHHFRLSLPEPIDNWLPVLDHNPPPQVTNRDIVTWASEYARQQAQERSEEFPAIRLDSSMPVEEIRLQDKETRQVGWKIRAAEPPKVPKTVWERLQEDIPED